MNIFFRFLFHAALILFSCEALAQVTVSGKCIDGKGVLMPDVIVRAIAEDGSSVTDSTNEEGFYELVIPPGITVFSYNYVFDTLAILRTVTVPDQRKLRMETVQFSITVIDEFVVKNRYNLNGIEPLELVDIQKLASTGGVERYLVYTTAASSNNELTSHYNVRGGNYDENLVYVNGFLINRPFLTRSGQQEGMSFINTALVENVYFSAGGFQSVFGDKLSSVLAIQYKRPDTLHASAMASLLGVEAHVEQSVGSRFRYLFGARYRANGYLLNSLPAKGNYNPVFWDAQLLTEFDLNENWKWTVLGHISSNTYQFAPQTQQTDFGTANEAYSFNIYFDGQEKSQFLTGTAGTSFAYDRKKLQSTTYFSLFRTNEREYFDIQGQYFINELETDPSKEAYGDSIAVLGIGTFLNHARNQLQAIILSAYNDSRYAFTKQSSLKWGAGIEQDRFSDVLSEWRMIDSAGYSQPQNGDATVDLYETIKGGLNLNNTKIHAYVQQHYDWRGKQKDSIASAWVPVDSAGTQVLRFVTDTMANVGSKWELEVGARALHTSYNNDFMITPRASITYFPVRYVYHRGSFRRRAMKFSLAAGAYYQPPFYREFRTFTGGLNPHVVAQKSVHIVAGGDYNFYMLDRDQPFRFSAEAYYKYLWDVNSYEVENVRTRYYADNTAKGYAVGLDMNLHGEFVPGIASFFKLGVLSTKEDILDDSYYDFYNAAGEKITGLTEDKEIADSVIVYPGYIRRPTDQNVNLAVLFQDNMPGFERFSVQMGLLFGSRLPIGPPSRNRYADTLSMKSYFRVDIGASYDFLHNREKIKDKWYGRFSDAIISFEVFNLLGINNVLSKQWVQDVEGNFYSIPNYLTQRRFNLKLIVRI